MGMTNEDAVKWLASIKKDLGNPRHECLGYYTQAIDEICELLKEQEPVKPNVRWVKGVSGGTCPKCLNWIQRSYNYCPFCGKAVKWHD